MNFMASRQGFYEDDTRGGVLRPFSQSSSTTTSSSSSQQKGLVPMSYNHFHFQQQGRRGWDEPHTSFPRCSSGGGGQGVSSQLDLMMDSSSPTTNNVNGDDADDSDDHLLSSRQGLVDSTDGGQVSGSGAGAGAVQVMIEREHMFDKVVTPSDVGKLNRLVIPKQHAEKYFPLDSSTNEKGLLLNFEDRNGKPWRFRYSYWNSSQSYVMTKGWSRFVKEKKLDAGDIVSFQRGVGELGKDRLFIDWRRRPDAPDHHHHHHHHLHHHHQQLHPPVPTLSSLSHHFSFHPWNHPYYLQQQVPLRDTCQNFLQVNAINNHPSHLNNNNNNNNNSYGGTYSSSTVMNGNPCPSSVLYLRSAQAGVAPSSQQVGIGMVQLQRGGGVGPDVGGVGVEEPMVYESVPVVQGKAAAKRFRLFGVNMECPISESDEQFDILSSTAVPHSSMAPQSHFSTSSSSSNIPPPCQMMRPYSGTPVLQTMPSDLLNKGKASSMSLDFDV